MADKLKKDQPWGQVRSNKSKIAQFGDFLYNHEKGEFLGRSFTSWLKITVFYIIYYALLAGFWIAMIQVFMQTIDNNKPKWIAEDGLIGGSPGLGFRPRPDHDSVESTLIWVKSDEKSWRYWAKTTTDFILPYEKLANQTGQHVTKCANEQVWAPDEKACYFDFTKMGNCTVANNFGYHMNKPCVILKLNKIYGWKPDYYKALDDLPDSMPKGLKNTIENSVKGKKNATIPARIWVWCEGENPADKENIGDITYKPHAGFNTHFYPYSRVTGYKSPLVALQFQGPKSGVLMNVECRAWAKNIVHNRMNRLGMVHFELLID